MSVIRFWRFASTMSASLARSPALGSSATRYALAPSVTFSIIPGGRPRRPQ